jgi:anti-anti-sigma regulatory factor
MLRQEKVSETETLLVVAGPLFGEAGVEFEKRMEGLLSTETPLLTLDLSMALGITSAAIGKLLSVHKRLEAQNRKIRISGCSEPLYKTFMMIKLNTLMDITR